jgi:transposase-like protein
MESPDRFYRKKVAQPSHGRFPAKRTIGHVMTTTSDRHQGTGPPVRQFDLSIPLKRFNGQESPDTEDTDLTEFVQAHLAEVFALSGDPPACAHCGDRHTRLRRSARQGDLRLPAFLCLICKRQFNRLTGTPLANIAKRAPVSTLLAFTSMLSQQMPYAAAAEKCGLHVMAVSRWTRRMRAWLLQLDPTGYWEAKVRLGVRPPDPITKCPSCGHTGPVTLLGFVPATRAAGERMRQCRCSLCRRVFRLHVEGRVSCPGCP